MSAMEMLRATEAAVVAGVSLRDVNRALDERILPDALFAVNDGRHVATMGCVFIAFYFDSAARLTSDERLSAIHETFPHLWSHRWASSLHLNTSMPRDLWVVHHDFLTIDLTPFVDATSRRLDHLQRARDLVETNSEILGGMPVIRGTRIPVYDVAASAAAGYSTERLLAAYPSLDIEMIELAATYAKAIPPRGRPRSIDSAPEGAKILVDRRIPRSRRA